LPARRARLFGHVNLDLRHAALARAVPAHGAAAKGCDPKKTKESQ
jgi:hypothetical protein